MGRWDDIDGIRTQEEASIENGTVKPASTAPMIGIVFLVIAGCIFFGIQGYNLALPNMPTVKSAPVQTNGEYAATGRNSIYGQMARDAANANGINPDWFENQMYDESGLNPNVPNGTSGEIGIAQILPSTAAGLGINPADPHSALYGAAGIMSRHYQHYGDYAMALSSYNAGPGTTDSAIRRCGAGWENCIPTITQAYIRNAMG